MLKKFLRFLSVFFLSKKKVILEKDSLYLESQLNKENFNKTYFYSLKKLISTFTLKYENRKIIQSLDNLVQIPIKFNFSKKDKIKLMKYLCFNRPNLDQDSEIHLILQLLENIGFKFDEESSSYFYSQYLFSRLKYFYDYKKIFQKLELLNFDFNKIQYQNKQLINRRLLESFSIKGFEQYKLESAIDLRDFNYKTHFLMSLSNIKYCDNLISWINYLLKQKLFFSKNSLEFLLMLKINSNAKGHDQLTDFLMEITPKNSFLYSLIKEGYDFKNIEIKYKFLIDLMEKSINLKEFVHFAFGKSNRHFTSLISKHVFKNKEINFSFIKMLSIFKDEDINRLYTMISDCRFQNLTLHHLEDEDIMIIKHISDQFSWERKNCFLVDAFNEFYLLKDLKMHYSQILKKNQNFKVEIKYTTFSKLINYLEIQHKRYYFQNNNLYQLENFPVLKRIDGLVVGDLRFEIPKTKYDLYSYGNQMINCIYTYSEKCEVKSSILIGIYKNEKLEYNIELGTHYGENLPLMSLYGPPIIYGSDRYFFGKLENRKKRRIIQFEKKYKQSVPLDDHNKIVDILTNLDIID